MNYVLAPSIVNSLDKTPRGQISAKSTRSKHATPINQDRNANKLLASYINKTEKPKEKLKSTARIIKRHEHVKKPVSSSRQT
jgi:hypothetical protein